MVQVEWLESVLGVAHPFIMLYVFEAVESRNSKFLQNAKINK